MEGMVRSIVESTVGTQYNTVTLWSSRNSVSPSPTRRPSFGPAMSVAPTAQVGQTSSIAKSNEIVMPW